MRHSHALACLLLHYAVAFHRFAQLIKASFRSSRFFSLKMLCDRDISKCFDKDITEYLDKYHNERINKYKDKLIYKHENKRIDKYKTKYIPQPLPQVQPSYHSHSSNAAPTPQQPALTPPARSSLAAPMPPSRSSLVAPTPLSRRPRGPSPAARSSHATLKLAERLLNAARTLLAHRRNVAATPPSRCPHAALTPARPAERSSHAPLKPNERFPSFTLPRTPLAHNATARSPRAAACRSHSAVAPPSRRCTPLLTIPTPPPHPSLFALHAAPTPPQRRPHAAARSTRAAVCSPHSTVAPPSRRCTPLHAAAHCPHTFQ